MVNKNHSDFKKYKLEWDNLVEQFDKEYDIMEEKTRYDSGKDGECAKVIRKYSKEFQQLKMKYSYLFE